MAERFRNWRDEQGVTGLSVDILTGYSCKSSEAVDALLFNKQNGGSSWQYVPSNGMRFLSPEGLRSYLAGLKELGVTTIALTFYGLKELHDAWAARKGDFDYNMLIATVASELGLHRHETIFLSVGGIDSIPELVGTLDGLAGEKTREVCPWDYRGRGKELEHERVLASQVAALPEAIRQFANPRCKSEAEWVAAIEAGDRVSRSKRAYLISVWEDNIDWLESADCGHILESIRDTDERLNSAIPSLPALAELYGEKAGERLYSLRDLGWKWTDLYLQAHPEVDSSGRFSDLCSVVLWH